MNGLWIYQQQRIYLTENSMLCYGHWCQSWGGGRVHGAPTPSLGGPVPPPRLRRLWYSCIRIANASYYTGRGHNKAPTDRAAVGEGEAAAE